MNAKVRRMALFALLLAAALATVPAPPAGAASGKLAAAGLRNADGTVNRRTGASGPVDLTGWRVSVDPRRGPVLAPQSLPGGTWSSIASGVDGAVYAIVLDGPDLYAGGDFTHVCGNASCDSGNLAVNHIAKWDGSSWSALGNGLNDGVLALVLSGGNLYAGGQFTSVCGNSDCSSVGATLNHLARWDGQGWSGLEDGVDGAVQALAAIGSDLYVGGGFLAICGDPTCSVLTNTPAYAIAHWNGTGWSSDLGLGVGGGIIGVGALATSGSDLYVGGSFSVICGDAYCGANSGNLTVNNVARWNGSSWSALGHGVSGGVIALATLGSDLYVGGVVAICGNDTCDGGNTPINNIARWDGSSWSSLAHGVGLGYGEVRALAVSGNDVYAAGSFPAICGNAACDTDNVTANHVARWDGVAWSPVGNGVNDLVTAVAADASNQYLGGFFSFGCGNATCDSGNTQANHIAQLVPSGGGCVVKPDRPKLKAPADNATTGRRRPKLKWNPATCAATYDVTVTDTSTGEVAFSATGLATLQKKTRALTRGATYRWFVQACDGAGCTRSRRWKFTVQ